jgi:hypothetical protein
MSFLVSLENLFADRSPSLVVSLSEGFPFISINILSYLKQRYLQFTSNNCIGK